MGTPLSLPESIRWLPSSFPAHSTYSSCTRPSTRATTGVRASVTNSRQEKDTCTHSRGASLRSPHDRLQKHALCDPTPPSSPPLRLCPSASLPVNHGKFPKQEDSYAFEEDSSSESLSPEQHHSDESQGSACPSSEAVGSAPSSSSSPALTSPRQVRTHNDEFRRSCHFETSVKDTNHGVAAHRMSSRRNQLCG